MKKRTRKPIATSEAELDMTSMIDVVFLLLIFFMCATKFKIPEGALRAYLPTNKGKSSNPKPKPPVTNVRFFVYMDGPQVKIMNLKDREFRTTQEVRPYEAHRLGSQAGMPDYEEIKGYLAAKMANTPSRTEKGLPVILDVANDVPYIYAADLRNLCLELGVEDLSMAMQEEEGSQ